MVCIKCRFIAVKQLSSNGLNNNQPATVQAEQGGYEHYQEKIDGHKIRGRSKSFLNFYSQAKLFYNSMSPIEKQHLKEAFALKLGSVNQTW